MPPPLYQYTTNLTVSPNTGRVPDVYVNILVWKNVLLVSRFSDVAKFTALTPLKLLS